MTSNHPEDVAEQWCGNCGGLTTEVPPPGMRWVQFRPRRQHVFYRLLQNTFLVDGNSYDSVVGSFVLRDGVFEEA